MLAVESRPVVPLSQGAPAQPSVAWRQIAEGVEPFLQAVSQRLAVQIHTFEPKIAEYAAYALTAQGKQLRPILVALSAQAAGALNDEHVTVAAVIEMVHLATLVHDDIIDEADLRRSRPTLAANWGNETSVLLGDCLFARSVKLASNFPTTEICRAVADATEKVCSGEILQSKQRYQFDLDRAEYFRVLAMKTAELFALACDLGAFLAPTGPEQRQALHAYGMALGTAYQVYDDCLDVFGSEAAAGKSLGTDLARGKITLPILIVLERGTEAERTRLQGWLKDWQPAHLEAVRALLEKYDALEMSRQEIGTFLAEARRRLEVLPNNPGRKALLALTDYLNQQVQALA